MPPLYVVEQGVTLSKDGERLLLKKDNKLIKYYHLHSIDQIILVGRINLTPPVISTLLKRNIDTVFMDVRGNYLGRLLPPLGKNSALRFAHFKKAANEQFSLHTAREMVYGKISNQRVFLRRGNRKGLGLDDVILRLKDMASSAKVSKDMQQLRGIEGMASKLYFSGIKKMLEGRFDFRERERRPPKDPVNSLLSLAYTLLLNKVIASIYKVGLDPYIGFFHTLDYGRPSLALDLMEEWRPIVADAVVVSCFNLGIIKKDNFERKDEGLYLNKAGWIKFIRQFEKKLNEKVEYPNKNMKISYLSCIEQQVRLLARAVNNEDQYRAAVFR